MNNEDTTDLSDQGLENNHSQNLDLSLSLSINESESQNQITSAFTSAETEVNVPVTRPRGQQGMRLNNVLPRNTTSLLTPSKRRYSDVDRNREFFQGESSRVGARRRLALSQGSTNNNLVASSYPNELLPAGEVESSESNFNLQTTTNATPTPTPPRFILPRPTTRRFPNIHHGWGLQHPSTNTGRSFFLTRRANGSTSSLQPVQGSAIGLSTMSGARPFLLNQRNIRENVFRINPQFGTGDQDNGPGPGIIASAIRASYQFGSYNNNISPSNAQTGVTGSTQQNSQEPDLSLALGYSGTVTNEGSSVARVETQTYNNSVPVLPRMIQVPDLRNLMWVNAGDQINVAISFLQAAIQHQHGGNLPNEDANQIARNLEELVERLFAARGQMGLTEEEILESIHREKFEPVGEDTPENKEKCCICQATYTDGEEVGKLDCVHRFHVDCIKQWLMIKNVCPLCKQTALATNENDE